MLASLPCPLEAYLSAIDGGSYFLYSVYSPPSGKDRDAPSTYTYSLYSLDSLRCGDLTPLWTVENAGYAYSSHPIDAGILVSWGGYDGSDQSYQLMGPEGLYFSGKAYSGLQPFSEDLAAASEGGLWGYLDREGNWAIPPSSTTVPISPRLRRRLPKRRLGLYRRPGRMARSAPLYLCLSL